MKTIFKKIIVWILRNEARLAILKYKPKIVAVTGSVGKTSTKDAVYTVLSEKFFTRKSEKSFNSEIGLPLTILGCKNAWNNPLLWLKNIFTGLGVIFFKNNYPKILVLEVGADRPGDIKGLAKWLKTDAVIITKIGKTPVHVEYFKSPKELFEEKASILNTLKKDGVLILNADDEDVAGLRERAKTKVFSYGIKNKADMTADSYSTAYSKDSGLPDGINFRLEYEGSSIPVHLPGVLGNQHMYALSASALVGVTMGLNPVEIAGSFENHETPRGRMRIIEGVKNSCIIDDTYNSSPVAVHHALETLKEINVSGVGVKIVVLGDMLELGKHSIKEHDEVGILASKIANMIIVVGPRARDIARSALRFGFNKDFVFEFEKSEEAGQFLQNKIKEGDVILLKGSQSIRMEKAVEEIMAHPEKASELLVRQEEEWRKR